MNGSFQDLKCCMHMTFTYDCDETVDQCVYQKLDINVYKRQFQFSSNYKKALSLRNFFIMQIAVEKSLIKHTANIPALCNPLNQTRLSI